MERSAGLAVVLVGVGLVLVGVLIWAGAFSWFGRLPGDIRYEGEGTRVLVPITSMIVLSVLATFVINIIGRLLR